MRCRAVVWFRVGLSYYQLDGCWLMVQYLPWYFLPLSYLCLIHIPYQNLGLLLGSFLCFSLGHLHGTKPVNTLDQVARVSNSSISLGKFRLFSNTILITQNGSLMHIIQCFLSDDCTGTTLVIDLLMRHRQCGCEHIFLCLHTSFLSCSPKSQENNT